MKIIHVFCIVSLLASGVTRPAVPVFSSIINNISNWSTGKKIAAAIGAVAAGYIVYNLLKKAEEPKQDSLSLAASTDEDQLLCDLEHQDYYRSNKDTTKNTQTVVADCESVAPLGNNTVGFLPGVGACDAVQSKNEQEVCNKQEAVEQFRADQDREQEDEVAQLSQQEQIIVAITSNDLATLSRFAHEGVDINLISEYGETALHYAACLGNIPLIKLFLDNGADINCSNNMYLTPLHAAIVAEKNAEETVAFLISAGADINKGAHAGFSPLGLAVAKGDENIVKLLLQTGADTTQKYLGQTLIEIAQKAGNRDSIIALLQRYTADCSSCRPMDEVQIMESISAQEEPIIQEQQMIVEESPKIQQVEARESIDAQDQPEIQMMPVMGEEIDACKTMQSPCESGEEIACCQKQEQKLYEVEITESIDAQEQPNMPMTPVMIEEEQKIHNEQPAPLNPVVIEAVGVVAQEVIHEIIVDENSAATTQAVTVTAIPQETKENEIELITA